MRWLHILATTGVVVAVLMVALDPASDRTLVRWQALLLGLASLLAPLAARSRRGPGARRRDRD